MQTRSWLSVLLAATLALLVSAPRLLAEEEGRSEADERQLADYHKLVPPRGGADLTELETDLIKMHTAREWALLTYPTGKLPSAPYEKARLHVLENVRDEAPWPGEGVFPRGGDLFDKALVTPQENVWTSVGPRPLDSVGTTNNAYRYGTVAGRVGASGLAVDPTNSNVAYAGFVAGGLWKTTNLLAANPTWTPLWDDKDTVVQSVGAIAIDPNDAQTIYAGTGDWAALDQFGSGIMKSTDGGSTWTQLAADVFAPYAPALPATGNRWSNQNVKVVKVDPHDSDTVLVGTRYDLYISHDGGASWEICPFGNGYTDPAGSGATAAINRVSSIYLDGRGAQTVAYVAVGYPFYNGNGNNGVYRFTVPAAGCPSWPGGMTMLNGGFLAGTGNGVNQESGGSNTGRIELAGTIGSDSKLTLYAQVAEAAGNNEAEGTYVLRPDDGATAWTKLSGSAKTNYKNCANSASNTNQDWYDLFIAADPANDKTLYIGHVDVFKATVNSTYTSMTLTDLSNVYGTSCPEYGTVHPDQHAFAWVGSSGTTFLLGNDGGVYRNTASGALAGWKQLNDSFNTNQFYGGQIGADFAGNGMGGTQWLFGGMQDNGNASWKSAQSNQTWTARSVGGDGFYTSFDPIAGSETAGWWITEYAYGEMSCSDTGAQGPFTGSGAFGGCNPSYTGSPDWSVPFMLDTLHCKSTSCSNYLVGEDYAWAATAYKNGAPKWSRISGSLVRSAAGAIITVNMAPSEPKAAAVGTSDGKVWWSQNVYSGTACTQAAANTGSFACTANTGASWTDVDASNSVLPNRAVLQVAFDPNDHNLFYAAVGGFDTNTPTTPGHVFSFSKNGSSFTVADKTGNLPDVPASSIAVNPNNRQQVFVGTYFGFYYTDDIDAASPVWVRYQNGLPNTVIKHLTIDRGPASAPAAGTTLAAFTYGRGVFVLKLPSGSACTPPAAPTGLSASATIPNRIDLSWSASAGASSYTVLRSTASGGPYSAIASGVVGTSHADTSVAGGTTYYYVVRAVAGCESESSNQAQATAIGSANNPPTASFTYSCTALGCSFDASGSSDSDGTITGYAWNFGDSTTATGVAPSHTYAAGGTYTVTLTVTDDDLATGQTSQPVTVSSGGGDTTPPVISNVASAKTGGPSFVITWTTDEPSTSQVEFVGIGTYSDGAFVTSHSMSFRGSKNALYTYYVRSTDAAGNTATAGPFQHQN